VLLLGNSGTEKMHIALVLGLAACQRGHRVRFTTTAALVSELIEARHEKKLLRFQKQIASYELLSVDELGFVPLSKTGTELLFEMLSQRYERGSTMPPNAELSPPNAPRGRRAASLRSSGPSPPQSQQVHAHLWPSFAPPLTTPASGSLKCLG
jgi:chromosomal replication initiation ATPase DnaA